MLILQRMRGESIIIDGRIRVTVIDMPTSSRVRLGIEAPSDITVHREEVQEKVDRQKQQMGRSTEAD